MSAHEITTRTATRDLTDEVRASPVDVYLGRLHTRLFWIAVVIAIVLLLI